MTPVRPTDAADAEPSGQPRSFDAPIWRLVGIIDDDGPTDGSPTHDKYLAAAYGDLHDR